MRRVLTILFALVGMGSLTFFVIQRFVQRTQPTIELADLQADYPLTDQLPDRIADNYYFAGVWQSNDIYKGQKAFDEALYQLAIVHFDRAINRNPWRFDLMLYHALSFLHLGKYSSAIPLLHQIVDHPDEPFATRQALWYLALAQLHSGNVDASRSSLDRLIASVAEEKEHKNIKEWYKLRSKLEKVSE